MASIKTVVGIAVGLLVVGLLLPVGLNEIANATMTNVDPAVVTMVQVVLPVLAVVGLAYAYFQD